MALGRLLALAAMPLLCACASCFAGTAMAQPRVVIVIEFDGITPSLPVSSVEELRMGPGRGSVFYTVDAKPVRGRLTLVIPEDYASTTDISWAKGTEWLAHFNYRGLLHYRPNATPKEIPPAEAPLRWSRPALRKDVSGSTLCEVGFVIEAADGGSLAPGCYFIRTSGFVEGAPFGRIDLRRTLGFTVSPLETDNDVVNLHEAMGDKLMSYLYVAHQGLSSLEAAKRRQEDLRLAREHYAKCLAAKPGDERVMLKIADISERTGNHKEALRVYSDVASLWRQKQGLGRVTAWRGLTIRQGTWQNFLAALEQHIERLKALTDSR